MNHYHAQPRDGVPSFFEPLLEYYNGLPPITRTWLALSLVITGLHTLDILPSVFSLASNKTTAL
jgi:hypothetical protein